MCCVIRKFDVLEKMIFFNSSKSDVTAECKTFWSPMSLKIIRLCQNFVIYCVIKTYCHQKVKNNLNVKNK
jgi:hypothetical protein